MARLASNPAISRLARDLGLGSRGNPVRAIRDFAVATVTRIASDSPVPADGLDTLRRLVANKYRLKVETINEDTDVERIASDHASFHPQLRRRLRREFMSGGTEGITLERDPIDPMLYRYLAVIDARGDRAIRAYFTAWHEVTHLVVHPEQLQFPGFRRAPSLEDIAKDPLESLVDQVAGALAFFPPLFQPIITKAMEPRGRLCFEAVEEAKAQAAPSASLYATALGSIGATSAPALLLTVGLGFKAGERRELQSGQQTLGIAGPPTPCIRALSVVANEAATAHKKIAIRRNMRVPATSVLTRALESTSGISIEAKEDQSTWETKQSGHLPRLSLHVEALRRGRYVYGLVTL